MEINGRYKIIRAYDLESLAVGVRAEQDAGWEPCGGPIVVTETESREVCPGRERDFVKSAYAQAMTRAHR